MVTLPYSLRCTAARFPDKEAILCGDVRLTYSELDAEVDRTAHALSEHGLVHGDRLALMAGNSERFVIVVYAALRIGASDRFGFRVAQACLRENCANFSARIRVPATPSTIAATKKTRGVSVAGFRWRQANDAQWSSSSSNSA